MPVPPLILLQASGAGLDPTPLLSADAGVSATMVAIVGGLLVARFVTIAGEQEGAARLVNDVRMRLARARQRALDARESLYHWNVLDFFDAKVIHAVGQGERDPGVLRRIGDGTRLTDEQITGVVLAIVDEFARARAKIGEMLAGRDSDDFMEWEEFRFARHAELPETDWEDVWQDAYEAVWMEPEPESQSYQLGYTAAYSSMMPTLSVLPSTELFLHRVNRRNSLADDLARAEQQVEDIEGELDRLKHERKAIVRPKGLGWGLGVLGYFTLVGVVLPLWLMSRGPDRLTAHLGEVVIWTFLSGLVALLSYMVILALGLARGQSKSKLALDGETERSSE